MNNQIICPHCKKTFLPEEGMRHQLEEERIKFRKNEEAKLRKELEEESAIKLKDKQNETEELMRDKRKLQAELLENNKKERELKKLLENKELEMQKKLQDEEDKIRLDARRKAEEENNLKNREKDKKLEEALKMAEEYKRKLEQGSQQTQGEVLEEYLESTLRTTFIYDEIQPVPKGIRGADVIQVVKNNRGSTAGKIIWESKRTKAWAGDWISKLKADKRSVNAEEAVLVTNVLPTSIKGFGNVEGVWITNYESIVGVATLLRTLLLMVAGAKSSAMNIEGKKDDLFRYIHSTQFRNRLEAIAEAFKTRREDIEVEKRWFTKKWAREEKLTEMLLTNNFSLKGEIEAITGSKIDDEKLVLEGATEE